MMHAELRIMKNFSSCPNHPLMLQDYKVKSGGAEARGIGGAVGMMLRTIGQAHSTRRTSL